MILESKTKDNSLQTLYDIRFEKFIEQLIENPQVTVVKYSDHHYSFQIHKLGCGRAFDAFPHQGKSLTNTRDFDDYFSSSKDEDDEISKPKEETTSVIIHPYEHSQEMREKTGRNYKEEAENTIETLTELVSTE